MKLEQCSLIDITPPISKDLAVWPGDQGFCRQESLSTARGDPLTLSAIQTTVHLGAHADAPNHYHPQGQDIASRKLHYYLGTCQVIAARTKLGERLYPQDLTPEIQAQRVLFQTNSYPNPQHFNRDFNSLSPELVDFLAQQGVILVGIDTPSIDPFDDQKLLSHQAIAKHDMAILEGLLLAAVSPGCYQLIALPLPIVESDASPVRALLLESPHAD